MSRFIYYCLMRLGGWRYIGSVPTDHKYVIISVPHTSMWDFVWGKFAFGSKRVNPAIFIKKEAFKFPIGFILKAFNAKPVNRGPGALSLIEQMMNHFENNDNFSICITPEGTRESVKHWKKGFYFIAQKANVPLYLGIIDYKQKIMTIGERFEPTGNYEKDLEYIKNYYKRHNPTPKYPQKFNWDIA